MLDDLNGINISGSGTLHVMAIGNVEIQGEAVTLFGNEGIELYEGKVNADGSVSVKAMITLTADGGEANMDVRGAAKTCYLAWEHGDLSDPSYRYRDAPDRRDYDYNQLATNVIAGVAVSLSLGVVAGVGGLMVAGSTTLGISVAVGGTWYVGMQAVTDVLGGRVSSTDAYLRKALAGGAVGFFSGAAPLAMAGAGLGQTMGIAFAEGALGSAVSQQILEEEIVWTRVIVDGAFSSVMEGVLWGGRNPGGVTEGTGDKLYVNEYGITMNQSQYEKYIKNANGLGNVKDLKDFNSRIPANAKNLPWRPVPGGAANGVKYQWTDLEGNLWNVRAHSIDPSAPAGSNASQGWVYRVEVRWGGQGKTYYMDGVGNYHPENVMKPTSPMYDANIANDTHIPLH